ncbi:uncharacterized protein [Garra rufa]|uniref:uncharacterized protein n=1 Tax=Garra rufa TaxID=137080 RepID=UPI003CCEF1A4
MFVLGLITCVALTAFGAQAKVVDSFEECKEFFYKGIEPSGMDQNAKKVCQKLENGRFYYATLYSVYDKIPLYSAYTLDPTCSRDKERNDIWHLEPQISQRESQIDYMVRETQNTQNLYRGNQSISRDYSNTGYDRGHLNPSSFQCSDGRTATFTLTNAAPMKEQFSVQWKAWETTLRNYLIQQLIKEGYLATAFIVTGTVPDRNVRIPHTNRVTVPSHVWTAVRYKHFYNSESFSFGFIGRNQEEDPDIKLMSISELNSELQLRFGTNQQIKIFADDCFGKLMEVQGVFPKFINLHVHQAIVKRSEFEDMKNIFSFDDSTLEKRVKVDEITGKMSFTSMSTFYNVAENLKAFTTSVCLITKAKGKAWNWDIMADDLECQLFPETKTAADGSLCSSVSESDYRCQCDTGGETKPCCTSPCVYQDNFNGYRCYSSQRLIECSPLYSLITVNGERCSWNQHCATYGYDYYWCKTTTGSWDYCSPPLWNSETINGDDCRGDHACGTYGYDYLWCYTDDEGNWDYC